MEDKVQKTHHLYLGVVKPKIIDLKDFFARSDVNEGFNPLLLNTKEKNLMTVFVQKWFEREDSFKPSWTIEELATSLEIGKDDLLELCFRLQLFNGLELPLNSLTLNWLFNSIKNFVEDKQRATMHWSVKMLWNPHMVVLGKENRFPTGTKISFWKLDRLSMFLAVKKEALVHFLKLKNVYLDRAGNYSSQDISRALYNSTNSELNTLLESNRTQKKSLRFATD